MAKSGYAANRIAVVSKKRDFGDSIINAICENGELVSCNLDEAIIIFKCKYKPQKGE